MTIGPGSPDDWTTHDQWLYQKATVGPVSGAQWHWIPKDTVLRAPDTEGGPYTARVACQAVVPVDTYTFAISDPVSSNAIAFVEELRARLPEFPLAICAVCLRERAERHALRRVPASPTIFMPDGSEIPALRVAAPTSDYLQGFDAAATIVLTLIDRDFARYVDNYARGEIREALRRQRANLVIPTFYGTW